MIWLILSVLAGAAGFAGLATLAVAACVQSSRMPDPKPPAPGASRLPRRQRPPSPKGAPARPVPGHNHDGEQAEWITFTYYGGCAHTWPTQQAADVDWDGELREMTE